MRELIGKLRELLPPDSHLVGGFVRDWLLGRKINDIDVVLKGKPEKFAQKVAEELGGSLFGFKKENLPARDEVYSVVLPSGLRVDISSFEDLEKDLSERDFTINALAWRLSDFPNAGKVVDPFGGLKDLRKRLVRAISRENLIKDPLRILRAYRIAAELGFNIEAATREWLKELLPLLGRVAKERVVAELLKGAKYPRFFELLKEDGVFKTLFGFNPAFDERKLSELEKVAEKLKGFESPKTYFGGFKERELLPWFVLFESTPTEKVKGVLKVYPFGEGFSKFLLGGLKGFRALRGLEDEVEFLDRFEIYLYPIGVLAYLNSLGGKFEKLAEFYEGRYKKLSKPLLSGSEVVELLGIKPSPLVGKILKELRRRQLEGEITTREEAVNFVKGFREKLRRS